MPRIDVGKLLALREGNSAHFVESRAQNEATAASKVSCGAD